jgi:serine/threonine-protein kinase
VRGRIGRYDIVGKLATGGMAEVLLGCVSGPGGFEQPLVIKRMLPHLFEDENFRGMFLDEARIVARIRHPNVVTVHDLGLSDGELYLVMEYLEGESLARLARVLRQQNGKLPPALGAYVVAEACAGLHAAHELTGPDGRCLDVVHRDVSPHNVFVLYDGRVKVIDFGVAKHNTSASHTRTGQVKGKLRYLAPEQCLAYALDRRADVFALGILLYEITTGLRLFGRENEILIFKAIVEEPILPPSVHVQGYPPALERICMRALARDLEQRYPTAEAMRSDLLAAMPELDGDGMPQEAPARLMHSLFASNIDDKRAKLETFARTASDAVERTSTTPGEADERALGAPADGVTDPTRQSHVVASVRESGVEMHVPPRRTRSRLPLIGATAMTLFAAASVYWLARREPAAPPAPVEPAAVVIDIRSTPDRANVIVDGVERGLTPLELALPLGSDTVTVLLRKTGYHEASERVVPDRAQRLLVALREEERAAEAPASAASSASGGPSATPRMVRGPLAPKPKPKGFTRFD